MKLIKTSEFIRDFDLCCETFPFIWNEDIVEMGQELFFGSPVNDNGMLFCA